MDDYAKTKEIVPFMEAPLLEWLSHNYPWEAIEAPAVWVVSRICLSNSHRHLNLFLTSNFGTMLGVV